MPQLAQLERSPGIRRMGQEEASRRSSSSKARQQMLGDATTCLAY